MAFTPTLNVSDDTTTQNLNDDSAASLTEDGYIPLVPPFDTLRADAYGQYPPELSEPAHVILRGGKAAIEATIAVLNRLFLQARTYKRRRVGARVYVQYKLANADTLFRSEISDGRIDYDPKELLTLSANSILEVVVSWTRRFFWEGAEAELALTNGNGSSLTGGINVFNANDGTGGSPNKIHNYVEIAAASVAGDLPAPVRLGILNATNNANKDDTVWIAHNVNSDPANLTHMLEAEAGTGGSNQADATCSGGSRKDLSVTASESELLTWTLSSALLSFCAGNYFTILARLPLTNSANINNTKFRLKLKDSTSVVWTGPQIRPDSTLSYAILPLGTVRLPPRPVESTVAALTLALWLQAVSGSFTVSLDFLQLSPLDSWRKLERVGDAVAYLDRWLDDEIADLVYVDTGAGTARRPTVRGLPGPILLTPNKLQRLYFLKHTNTAYTCEFDRKSTVQVYYRPRRLAL